MSIRSYSGLIILETVFDSVPDNNPDLNTFMHTVFTPYVQVTEVDCGTALGEMTSVNYDLEGKVELSTGQTISKARIEQLLSQGIYQAAVRTLSTCIAKEGVCQACYHASHQYESVPDLGDSVQIIPEYVTGTDVLAVISGDTKFALSQAPDLYDLAYVYYEGTLIDPSSYEIDDSTLRFNSGLPRDGQLTVRYTTITRAPFLAWLAGTYAGSLLGLSPLPSPKLPIRKRLLTSLIPLSMLDLLSNQISDLKEVPSESVSYLDKLRDPLEKSLFVIALFGIFLNVI